MKVNDDIDENSIGSGSFRPFVRGMDPRIRTKMSWIRNTGRYLYAETKGSNII